MNGKLQTLMMTILMIASALSGCAGNDVDVDLDADCHLRWQVPVRQQVFGDHIIKTCHQVAGFALPGMSKQFSQSFLKVFQKFSRNSKS